MCNAESFANIIENRQQKQKQTSRNTPNGENHKNFLSIFNAFAILRGINAVSECAHKI